MFWGFLTLSTNFLIEIYLLLNRLLFVHCLTSKSLPVFSLLNLIEMRGKELMRTHTPIDMPPTERRISLFLQLHVSFFVVQFYTKSFSFQPCYHLCMLCCHTLCVYEFDILSSRITNNENFAFSMFNQLTPPAGPSLQSLQSIKLAYTLRGNCCQWFATTPTPVDRHRMQPTYSETTSWARQRKKCQWAIECEWKNKH